jgi:glutathione S-transferase
MLIVYGAAKSRAVRTLWMLGELGIAYEHKNWLPRSTDTQTAAFGALNPNRRVPIIDDEGFVLSESMAINLYLAKKHKSPLYPTDPHQEALAWQWSLWETDRLDRQIVNHARHTQDLPVAERKPEVAKAAWEECVIAFDVLEVALNKTPYLAGAQFSVADLNVASALYRGLVLDLSLWPKTNAWLHRCWERAAAQKAQQMRG